MSRDKQSSTLAESNQSGGVGLGAENKLERLCRRDRGKSANRSGIQRPDRAGDQTELDRGAAAACCSRKEAEEEEEEGEDGSAYELSAAWDLGKKR